MAAASPTSEVDVASPAFSRRPQSTPFKQQSLPSLQPTYSPPFFIVMFLVFGVLFIALGASILVESDAIQSVEVQYDGLQSCTWEARRYNQGWGCAPIYINFTITKTMQAPLFLYYKVTNFHQNNRRFVRSVSNTQLSGNTDYSAAERNDCQPFKSPNDFVDFSTTPVTQLLVNGSNGGAAQNIADARYHPCGLIPWSMFNDTLALMAVADAAGGGGRTLICDGGAFDDLGNPTNLANSGQCEKRGIAWNSLAGVLYNPVPNLDANPDLLTHRGWPDACKHLTANPSLAELNDMNWYIYACNGWYIGEPGHRIPNPLDEDLWVWNRIASYSTFKKLYRRITVDLPPGDYTMRITQRWDVSSFGGTKAFVLENTGWVGSKNYFLGALFTAAGCLSFVFAVVCLAVHLMQPPRLTT